MAPNQQFDSSSPPTHDLICHAEDHILGCVAGATAKAKRFALAAAERESAKRVSGTSSPSPSASVAESGAIPSPSARRARKHEVFLVSKTAERTLEIVSDYGTSSVSLCSSSRNFFLQLCPLEVFTRPLSSRTYALPRLATPGASTLSLPHSFKPLVKMVTFFARPAAIFCVANRDCGGTRR